MELETLLFLAFAISTLGDILIAIGLFVVFHKLVDTKALTTENNRELYEHSTDIASLQEKLKN